MWKRRKRQKVPQVWLAARVLSIFIKIKRNDFSNCMGICLIDAAYTIRARIINQRLQTLSKHHIFEEQNVFRKTVLYKQAFVTTQVFDKRRVQQKLDVALK